MFNSCNIANQFDEADPNSHAVLCFAVESLKVKHVIVMGHYGCAGVAASMVPPPPLSANPVQDWIWPIHQIYETSKRPEIASHRTKYAKGRTDAPGLHDPAFRALVEENVKANVTNIAQSAVMQRVRN
jgi:carbonic anhydrase